MERISHSRRAKFHANYYHCSLFSAKDAVAKYEEELTIAESPVETFATPSLVDKIMNREPSGAQDSPSESTPQDSSSKNELKEVKLPAAGKSTLKARGVAVNSDTDVKEVWFAGDHGDVGGGHVLDSERHALSNIPLRWMVKEVMESDCGILFEGKALQNIHVNHGIPYYFPPLDERSDSASSASDESETKKREGSPEWTGTDDVRVGPGKSAKQKAENEVSAGRDKEIEDAKSSAHDQLKKSWWWWLLEIIPTHYMWQDEIGEWHTELKFYRGRGRIIREKNPSFHYTVKERMEIKELGYVPRAKWERGTERYVE